MIVFKHQGNFKNTERLLKTKTLDKYQSIFEKYGREGVEALKSFTPVDSGKTASSWDYKIQKTSNGLKLIWSNSNIVNGAPIAILIQYGHATGNGGYVQGVDYINPAMRPIFDKLTNDLWKEVKAL